MSSELLFTFAGPGGKTDNLWVQPPDGSPGHQVTKFNSESIADFSISPDGKSFAVVRQQTNSDVVLLQELTLSYRVRWAIRVTTIVLVLDALITTFYPDQRSRNRGNARGGLTA